MRRSYYFNFIMSKWRIPLKNRIHFRETPCVYAFIVLHDLSSNWIIIVIVIVIHVDSVIIFVFIVNSFFFVHQKTKSRPSTIQPIFFPMALWHLLINYSTYIDFIIIIIIVIINNIWVRFYIDICFGFINSICATL